jgi:lactoylglutathione lyase
MNLGLRRFSSQICTKVERPFRILGLQQVAIGSTSREELIHLWVDVLGLKTDGKYTSEKENVDEIILKLGSGDSTVELDLMVPLDINKSPKVNYHSV